jgi:Domain of unknown function (DUF222)
VLEMQNLEAAVGEFEAAVDLDFVNLGRVSGVINRLEGMRCAAALRATARGEHMLVGKSSSSWVAEQCQMSKNAASDRLCVGAQLEKLPRVARALSSGEIGYQAASVICHLQERISQVGAVVDEEQWVGMAREWSLKNLSLEAASTWHGVDPAGFNAKVEEAHERRQLYVSECGDMYRVDGWLEVDAGIVVKAAIDSLARPLGPDDTRTPRQRRADGLVEGLIQGAHPQISVHTTLAGLKGEVGAAASELAEGTPISSQTVQRLACDGVLHRVLKADSMVIDVGRARRTAQPAQWRGLKARYKTCAWTGCDRPIGWTQAHHVDFWAKGGKTDLGKMIPLCHHHHRLVHEGGWQVVQTSQRLEFIPPDRPVMVRRRWGERRWAA